MAFLFAVPWALWHRMWLAAVVIALAQGVLGGMIYMLGLNEAAETIAALGLAVIIGGMADELRRANLGKRGYAFADVVVAENLEIAERRILDRRPEWIAGLMGAQT